MSVTGISRTGAVIAVSSGLVASMGLPAGAVTRDTPNTETLSRTAPAGVTVADPSLQAVPSSFVSGAPLSAPEGASPAFDQSSFTAVPKPAAPAPAPAPASRSTTRSALRTSTATVPPVTGGFGTARGSSVIAVAARYTGVAYRYGGTTPAGFDCSGYTQYVFAQLGVSLPRTAGQQYGAVTRIPSSQAQAGDLVFFLGSGGVYHVGIYAGGGMLYDAGKPGEAITKRAIWSANIAFGRI
ncbi:MAG TPA: NlpC/P60 family protein [Kineosporiaceae bacterium]|nr:NlpC/P60 family protein [Kineosporiaceae bacterium]